MGVELGSMMIISVNVDGGGQTKNTHKNYGDHWRANRILYNCKQNRS